MSCGKNGGNERRGGGSWEGFAGRGSGAVVDGDFFGGGDGLGPKCDLPGRRPPARGPIHRRFSDHSPMGLGPPAPRRFSGPSHGSPASRSAGRGSATSPPTLDGRRSPVSARTRNAGWWGSLGARSGETRLSGLAALPESSPHARVEVRRRRVDGPSSTQTRRKAPVNSSCSPRGPTP